VERKIVDDARDVIASVVLCRYSFADRSVLIWLRCWCAHNCTVYSV